MVHRARVELAILYGRQSLKLLRIAISATDGVKLLLGLVGEIRTLVTALRTRQTSPLFDDEIKWRPCLVMLQNPLLERELCELLHHRAIERWWLIVVTLHAGLPK